MSCSGLRQIDVLGQRLELARQRQVALVVAEQQAGGQAFDQVPDRQRGGPHSAWL